MSAFDAEKLARDIRAAVGELNDPEKPVVTLARDIADVARAAGRFQAATRSDRPRLVKRIQELEHALRIVQIWADYDLAQGPENHAGVPALRAEAVAKLLAPLLCRPPDYG